MAQTDQRAGKPAPENAQWDIKRGKPKDEGTTRTMEKAHGRYSASGQSEERQKRDPVKPPQSHDEDGYAHEPSSVRPKQR